MKLPAEMLQKHLAAILEGILLWAEDSKNKFKLKVCTFYHHFSTKRYAIVRKTLEHHTDRLNSWLY